MQILVIVMGVVGIILLFFGIKWSWKSLKAKEIIQFPFSQDQTQFKIEKTGLFSLCILGGRYLANSGGFGAQIFRKNMKMGVEFFHFTISQSGGYILHLENQEDLIVKTSMIKIKQLFQSPQLTENLQVLIKETIPVGKRIMGIIFLVLGVNMTAWGIMLGIYPNLFG